MTLNNLFCFTQNVGQIPNDSIIYELTEKKINKFFKHRENGDSLLFYLNSSISKSLKNKLWSKHIKFLTYKGHYYFFLKQYDDSKVFYEKAINITRKKKPNKRLKLIELYNYLGNLYIYKFNFLKAINTFKKSIKLYELTGNNQQVIIAMDQLSYVYMITYDLNKSLDFLEQGFLLRNEKELINAEQTGKYYDNLGSIYFLQKKYKYSELYFNKALKIFTDSNIYYGIIDSYNFLGDIERKRKNFKKALSFYNKGEKIGLKHLNKNKVKLKLQLIYLNKGLLYSELKSHEKAHLMNLKSLKITKNKKHSLVNLHLGDGYQNINLFDSALNSYQKGIKGIQFSFDNDNVYFNPKLGQYSYKFRLLELLRSKSRAFYNKYFFEGEKTFKDINAAFETNQLALELVDIMLDNYESSGTRLAWSEFMRSVYYQSIIISQAMYKATGEEKYLHKAFEVAEKSKAGVLMADMKTTDARKFSGIADSLLNKERDIRVELSYQKSLLQKEEAKKEKQDTLKVNEAKEKIFALNRERENLEELFEKEYPKYHELKYNKAQPTVAQLQESIEPNNTLIEYFVGDSTLYAFTITKSNFEVKELNYPDSLAEKIQSLPQLLIEKKKEEFSEISYELYQSLIAPLDLASSNLTIIPDGPLWQLNFDLLLSQKPEKLDYRKFQYLIKDYTISYAYSAKLLNQDVNYPKQSTAKNEVLAFSYNNPDDISVGSYIAMRGFRNAQLGDLPGTRKEIKAVSSVVDGAYYYGSYANEKNFKEKAKDYNILHLALHGVIDHEDPMNSKLYFTQDKDTLEDNYLHAYELYNLELNAELAVLSACQTGSGKLIKGEGVMSLGRAFTYAGCKSILLSQWDVSDAFTPGLMKDFYKNLKEGKTKAASLREAKLTYLAKADNLTSNPYYWAPLVQLGDNKPLKQDSYLKWVIGVSIIMLLIVLAFYLRNKRKVSEV